MRDVVEDLVRHGGARGGVKRAAIISTHNLRRGEKRGNRQTTGGGGSCDCQGDEGRETD